MPTMFVDTANLRARVAELDAAAKGLGVQIAALQSLIDWIATGTDGEASQAAIRTTTERKSEAEALLVRLERARDRLAAAADVCDAAQSNTDRHW